MPLNVVVFIAYSVLFCGIYVLTGNVSIALLNDRRFGENDGLPSSYVTGFVIFQTLCNVFLVITKKPAAGLLLCLSVIGVFVMVKWRLDAGKRRVGPPDSERRFVSSDVHADYWVKGSLLLVLVFAFCSAGVRFPWLLEISHSGQTAWGTDIYDDMRTLGFPLSLAAHGYPLVSPYAPEIRLVYPTGLFAVSSGFIALVHKGILGALVADTFLTALFFGLGLFLVSNSFVKNHGLRLVTLASILITPAFNLRHLNRLKEFSGIGTTMPFRDLFFKYSPGHTTIAWNTFSASFWISNHCVGMVIMFLIWALLIRAIVDKYTFPSKYLFMPGVLALSLPLYSADMAVMGVLIVGLSSLSMLIKYKPYDNAFVPPFRILALMGIIVLLAGASFVYSQWGSISREIDSLSQFSPIFPLWYVLDGSVLFNMTYILSGYGPYLLVLLMLFVSRVKLNNEYFAVPVVSALLISMVFHHMSIWVMRVSIILHALFAIYIGSSLEISMDRISRRKYIFIMLLWLFCLLPGVVQIMGDLGYHLVKAPRISASVADCYRWILANTSVRDRVVEYRPSEKSLVPDVKLLRTGNRAGRTPFDRYHALIGSTGYKERMSDMRSGIAANDYIVFHRDDDEFEKLCESSRLAVVYRTGSAIVWKVTKESREYLAGRIPRASRL